MQPRHWDGRVVIVSPTVPRREKPLVPTATIWLPVIATVVAVGHATGRLGPDQLRQWGTVFLALILQALPFLVLGTVLAGVVSAYVRPAVLARIVPRNTVAAVGVAGLAGAALPGCECSSVPLARRLEARGVPAPAALTFLLSAPAVNPVVVVATLVAFPGRPEMAAAGAPRRTQARWMYALRLGPAYQASLRSCTVVSSPRLV